MPYYQYDLEGIDLEDCTRLLVLPVNADCVPAIMGTLEALTWRARHTSDASQEIGIQLYDQLQEIFIVNDCITDLLAEIRDALASLSCICDLATLASQQSQTAQESEIRQALTGNTNVDFTDDVDVNYDQGEVPEEYDSVRCQEAQAVFWNIASAMRQVAEINLGGGILALGGFVSILAAFSVISLPISIIVGVLLGIAGLVLQSGIDSDLDTWEGAAQEAVCTIYTSQDAASASAGLKSLADSVLSTAYVKSLVGAFYSPSMIGHYLQESNNVGTFDGDFCSDCVIPEGCYNLTPCVPADWDGSSGSCQGDYWRHIGGTGFWTRETWDTTGMTEPWMVVTWLPTGDSDLTAKCRLGARRTSDDAEYVEFLTADRPQDVVVTEYFALSTQLYNQEIEFGIKQESWYATPMQVCVVDGDPR